ncbi:MAG: LysR family transcriptional regulator [Acidobacteriia bacterium]|nr:LysR family transcriptional regulator [Terriglobia bacterium]
MEWLNYHHLQYFWVTARTGSIAKASRELLLSPPTISTQISSLESNMGEKLFERSGRRLVLTDMGKLVFRYADEIFSLGRELTDTLKGRPTGHPLKLVVGLADVLPKGVAYKLIEPAMRLGRPVRIICREDPPDRLLALLALQELDLVLTDAPIALGIRVKAYSHLLCESGLTFLASRKLARAYGRDFPRSLDGAPFLLPTDNTAIRQELNRWFEAHGVHPQIIGEFEDDALLAEFGRAGLGIVPSLSILDQFKRPLGLHRIGSTDEALGRIYAISIERKLKHPAVVAICEKARDTSHGPRLNNPL